MTRIQVEDLSQELNGEELQEVQGSGFASSTLGNRSAGAKTTPSTDLSLIIVVC